MKQFDFLKKELKKIEKDGRSFLGIDGGNINSPVWFCGIEFGSNLTEMENYYGTTVKYYKTDDFDLGIPYRENAGKFGSSIYDRYLSAMYINLFKSNALKDGSNTKPIEDVLVNELYSKGSNIFKMNLFPLAKKSTEWDRAIENQIGIKKEVYYTDIFTKRKVFIKELVQKFKPEIIICTSTSEYEETFLETFLDENQIIEYQWEYLRINDKKFKISKYRSDITTIIVIPFLGRGNLSSYKYVLKMANFMLLNHLDL